MIDKKVHLPKEDTAFDILKKNLDGDFACVILITCTQPSAEGKMDVQLNFEGDDTLAAFLLENARAGFDTEFQESK